MTTTIIRIDDPAQWREGDVLTVFNASGKEILRGVLVGYPDPDDESHLGLRLGDPDGFTARWLNGDPLAWLTQRGRTYTVTREVPALPTEPNKILLDVETDDGTVYPVVRVRHDGALNAYGSDGRFVGSVQPADVVAWTPVVRGERVTR